MKPGRNDPCPCGSGRKYKHCCGAAASARSPARSFDIEQAVRTAIRHHRDGSIATAEQIYRRVLAVQPDNPAALGFLGAIAHRAGRAEDAVALIGRAIEFDPKAAVHHNNYAEACRRLGRLDEAVEHYNIAIALGEDRAEVRCNLGNALVDQFKLNEAMEQFQKAIDLQPDFALGHWCRSLALLRSGDYPRGWPEHEWRWQWKDFPSPKRDFAKPLWDGGDISGLCILLHAEQGYGDAIQFVRYAPLVAERAARVVVECQPPLKSLFETMDGVEEVVARGAPLPAHDVHCPLSSLPLRLRTTVESIPARIPYLHAAESAVNAWRARLHAQPGGFRVGLAWSGNPTHENDRNRSCPLRAFAHLMEIPGTRFYSLQKGAAAAQIRELPGSKPVDLTDALNDFADTAAFIDNLDLVISVDTSVAHLAGAIGKPVWLLLPLMPDWRWMLDRPDSPWYPGMRLFRQTARGDWAAIMERVAAELRALVGPPR